MKELPIKLETNLINEAVFEVRFSSVIPPEAVFGIVYQIVVQKYPHLTTTPLPISQLPEVIRNTDPNLKYNPHYSLATGSFLVNIGPRSVVFSVQKPYIGWTEWKKFMIPILNNLTTAPIIDTVERTGLRYINIISGNVFPVANVSIEITQKKLLDQSTTLRTEEQDGNYTKILQIANNAIITINGKNTQASLLDIDICNNCMLKNIEFKNAFERILEESHDIEKVSFFNVLTDDFIKTLKPIYKSGSVNEK
jgi:uncharacterized protein (TIGR04255 family)